MAGRDRHGWFLGEKGRWERPIPYLCTHPTHVLLAFCKHLYVCSLPISRKAGCGPPVKAAAEAGVWFCTGCSPAANPQPQVTDPITCDSSENTA